MNKIIIVMLLAVASLAVAAFMPPSDNAKADTPDPIAEAQAQANRLVRARHAATADENRKHARIYVQVDRIGAMAARGGNAKLRAAAERTMDLENARYAAALSEIQSMAHAPADADSIVVLPLQPTAEERASYAAAAAARLDASTAARILAELEAQLTTVD